MSTPQPAPPAAAPAPAANPQGSLGIGVAIAWGVLVGGYALSFGLVSGTLGWIPGFAAAVGPLIALGPWLFMLFLIFWFATHGKPRTAIGIAVGIASIIGVALLLVAACFGLMSNNGWH